MKRSFWSNLLFALTFLGVLLTFANWLGRPGQAILFALTAGLLIQAVPVYLISTCSRSRSRHRLLKGIEASGGRITARLAADPHCILELDLTNTTLEDRDWESLPALVHLETLHLSQTRLADGRLDELSRLPVLRHLILDGTLITEAGLSAFRDFPQLETLSLTGSLVTLDGLEELLHSLPELQVIAGHVFGSTDLHSLQDISYDSFV